jgi:hypothetical protein
MSGGVGAGRAILTATRLGRGSSSVIFNLTRNLLKFGSGCGFASCLDRRHHGEITQREPGGNAETPNDNLGNIHLHTSPFFCLLLFNCIEQVEIVRFGDGADN